MICPLRTWLPRSTLITSTRPATLKLNAACSSAASVPGAVTVWVSRLASEFPSLTCLTGRLAAPPSLPLDATTCDSPPRHAPAENSAIEKRSDMTNLSFACSIFQFRKFSRSDFIVDATQRVTGIISRRTISSTRTRQNYSGKSSAARSLYENMCAQAVISTLAPENRSNEKGNQAPPCRFRRHGVHLHCDHNRDREPLGLSDRQGVSR